MEIITELDKGAYGKGSIYDIVQRVKCTAFNFTENIS